MIKIYTSTKDMSLKLIKSIEEFFKQHIKKEDLTIEDLSAIDKIDKGTFIENTYLIDTPFGVTEFYNISDGCKTIIVTRYIIKNNMKQAINLNNCGKNALIEFFLNFIDLDSNIECFISYNGNFIEDNLSNEIRKKQVYLNDNKVKLENISKLLYEIKEEKIRRFKL